MCTQEDMVHKDYNFYNCVLDIKDTSGFFNMLLLIYGVGLPPLCQKPHKK